MNDIKTEVAQHKKYLPILLGVSIFMQMLDATILNTALPAIAKSLNQSPLNMQAIIISYTLTLAIFIPISGFLADKFGTKNIFLLAVGLFCFGSLMCAFSPTLNMLVISRIIQGIGGSLLTPVARLALIKSYPKKELLKALNYAIMPALLGPIIGPLLGGYLVEIASWHWIFLINIPIGAIGILVGIKHMPDFNNKDTHFDLPGFLLFSGSACLLTLGLEYLGTNNTLAFALFSMCSGGILLWGYYFYAVKYNSNAIYPTHLFQVRTFRVGIMGNFAARIGISAIPFLLPLLLQVSFGYSASTAGWLLTPLAISAILTKSFIPGFISRFGYRKILMLNTILVGIGIMSIGLLSATTPIWVIVTLLFFIGTFNSLQFSAMNTLTLANLRDYQNSSGNSLMAVNQQLSIGFGIAIGAMILRFLDQSSLFEQHNAYLAFRWTFFIVGFSTIASGFVFSLLHTKDGDNLLKRTH